MKLKNPLSRCPVYHIRVCNRFQLQEEQEYQRCVFVSSFKWTSNSAHHWQRSIWYMNLPTWGNTPHSYPCLYPRYELCYKKVTMSAIEFTWPFLFRVDLLLLRHLHISSSVAC